MNKADSRNIINIKIGERIRQYRTKANLTQDELSEQIGISQKHLSRIESGYHNSHFVTIMEIAKALNVPIDVFAEDLSENANSELINIIVSEISGMSSGQLQMLRDSVNLIKSYDVDKKVEQ